MVFEFIYGSYFYDIRYEYPGTRLFDKVALESHVNQTSSQNNFFNRFVKFANSSERQDVCDYNPLSNAAKQVNCRYKLYPTGLI